jgi:hypothetical protein
MRELLAVGCLISMPCLVVVDEGIIAENLEVRQSMRRFSFAPRLDYPEWNTDSYATSNQNGLM